MQKKIYIYLVLFLSISTSLSRTVTNEDVVTGINQFYEARFDEALYSLQKLISSKSLTGENLFMAYLYSAFSLIRLNAPPDSVAQTFERAIYVNPRIMVDNSKIPPDLYEQYLSVRMKTLGGLVIRSLPPAASVLMYQQGSDRIMRHYTPVYATDLIAGRYELVIAKEGYLPRTARVRVLPNQSDTLLVELEKKEGSLVKKYWPWAGGFVVATSLLLSQLFDREPEKPEPITLPGPPARPERP